MFRQTLVLVLLVQGAVVVLAAPMLVGLFDLSLRAAGVTSVTNTTVSGLLRSPGGVALTAVAAAATVAALLAQIAIFLRVADDRQRGRASSVRSSAHDLAQTARRLLRRPSTLLLIPYLLLLVPLGHLGANSFLTRWVAIPAFVTDELLKEPTTGLLYIVAMLAIGYVNVRLLFVLPLLTLTDDGMIQATIGSWRLTRWRTIRLFGLVLGVTIPAGIVITALALVALLPTRLADAVAPPVAPIVAAVSFGLLEVAVFMIVGVFALIQTQTLVAALHGARDVGEKPVADPSLLRAGRGRKVPVIVAGVGAVLAAAILSVQAVPIMQGVSDGATLVLAHRGFTEHGVENTIPALEAAREAGADFVEMDIQQTSDRQWVLMHDLDLERLAGVDTSVAKLTLKDATDITVRSDDMEAKIPSLEAYLTRANDIDQPLLIEIKVHGGESADYLDGLLDVLDRNGGADSYIYHSLSADVVEGLEARRPELVVGYIVPVSFGGVPDTPADFLVLEQSAYSPELRARIHDTGRSVFVWTVQEPDAMRALFRDNVDGIISDHPDVALQELDRVSAETSVTQRILDAVERIVVPMQ